MTTTPSPPPPPPALARYVGDRGADPVASYLGAGRSLRSEIERCLPADWTWEGRSVLDFGCGSGRVLRHFLAEAAVAHLHGCDIDRASIEWASRHMAPPLQLRQTAGEPPLPYADGSFDLVWALSVLTHIGEGWSAWLLELHRVLRGDGLLIATFMGEGMSQQVAGEAWQEDRVGMNVLYPGLRWDGGGPMVLHSPWWIRAHWGRAFEILELRPTGVIGAGQGIVVMRRRDVLLAPGDLERLEPGERREVTALAHTVRQLQRELVALNAERDGLAELARRRDYPTRLANLARRLRARAGGGQRR